MALDKDTLLMATLRKVQKIGKRLKSNRTSNKAGFCKEIDSQDWKDLPWMPEVFSLANGEELQS